MYSFSSFFKSFSNFGQAKAEVADAKKESTETKSYQQNSAFLARRNHGGPGTGDKFGRYGEGEYEKLVTQNGKKEYTNSFVNPVLTRPPTYVNSYTNNLIGKPLNYEHTRAWQRANKGYSTGTIFSSGISRLGSLTSLFNSAINDPFGHNNGSSRWT